MSTDIPEKTTLPEQATADPVRWLWFLPRWSLVVGLTTLGLPIVFFDSLGRQAADNVLGTEYVELLHAVRNPALFRAAWTLDATIWLMIGGSLLALAGMLRRHVPIRATFIAVCGIGQLFGSLAGFMRLNGVSELAGLYVHAAPVQQAAFLESYINLLHVINSHYHLAVLLFGVGYLLAAWSTYSLHGFPHWLAIWLALPGLVAVVQFVNVATGAPFSRLLNILTLIVGNITLNFAIAIALWRPSPTLVSAVAAKPTES